MLVGSSTSIITKHSFPDHDDGDHSDDDDDDYGDDHDDDECNCDEVMILLMMNKT